MEEKKCWWLGEVFGDFGGENGYLLDEILIVVEVGVYCVVGYWILRICVEDMLLMLWKVWIIC